MPWTLQERPRLGSRSIKICPIASGTDEFYVQTLPNLDFLKEPTVLTDEDVMELLTFIFQSEAVQKKLNLLIESRRETQEADEGKNP